MAPTTQHIALGERDLSFIPAEPARARTLRPEDVADYNEHGYLSPVDVFDAEEAAVIRAYFDDLIDAVVSADDRRNGYSINTYHLVCQGLYDLGLEPRILDLVTDILGPDLVCWGNHLFAKLPQDPMEVPLHQDAVYWPFTSTRSVTVWLAIDDADDANAAMHFVPGSHRHGPLVHDELELDGTRVLGRRVRDAAAYHDRRVVNELRAGQVSLHSDLLLHGSRANVSDRRRAGLTLRYGAGDLAVSPGWERWLYPAVHARGRVAEHWPDRSRPDGEHPERMAQFTGDFDGNPPCRQRDGTTTRRPVSHDSTAAQARARARRPAAAGTGGGSPARKALTVARTRRSKAVVKVRSRSLK